MNDDFLRACIAFFAIIDPLGNLLVFALLTREVSPRTARFMAFASTLVALAIIAVFVFGGREVLDYLDISQESFQIAAGALLLLPAYRMVEHGEPWQGRASDTVDRGVDPMQLAFVPLAIPLIAGPGALATAITFADRMGTGTALAAASTVLALTLALFLLASVILRAIGGQALRVVTRLVGVLLMAIAVDFIVGGLDVVFA